MLFGNQYFWCSGSYRHDWKIVFSMHKSTHVDKDKLKCHWSSKIDFLRQLLQTYNKILKLQKVIKSPKNWNKTEEGKIKNIAIMQRP